MAPQIAPDNEQFDTIVIGAGIAGLAAALRLQAAGQRVLVIERRSTPGGLCGTLHLDGYEFALACNDFGRRTERELTALGVPVAFHKLASRFFDDAGYIQSPPDVRTVLRLLRWSPGILRLIRILRKVPAPAYVGELLERHRVATPLRDLLGIAAYGLGTPLSALPVDTLFALFSRELSYGYDQAMVPVGGPGVLIARMLQRFEQLGGRLRLDTPCERIEGTAPTRRVITPSGELTARAIVSSEGRWAAYPAESRASLEVGMLLLAVPETLPFPRGFHTLGYFPSGCAEWLEQLDQGVRPSRFGFHLFRNDLPQPKGSYTLNAYFLLPRGWESPDAEQVRWVEDFLFEHAERLLPGLREAVLYKRFLSPRAFTELTGLSSVVVPRLRPAGFEKPPSHAPEQDIYYVGNSVPPLGEHAAGALVSGLRAAESILQTSSSQRR